MDKIPFTVIRCSSYDDGFEPTELEPTRHGPTTRGWQSQRFCDFPQKLVLQLDAPAAIGKLQILSHQSKIASTIDVYIGTGEDYRHARFQRVGFLSLDANQRSNFRARELKSVFLDIQGRFLKLVAQRCHTNGVNLFNQVGIVAINVLGRRLSHAPTPTVRDSVHVRAQSMHQALQRLAAEKEEAIAREDYDAAKRVKAHMRHWQDLQTQVAMLEQRKQAAIEREDYDSAKMLKAEIDELIQSPPQPQAPIRPALAESQEEFDVHVEPSRQPEWEPAARETPPSPPASSRHPPLLDDSRDEPSIALPYDERPIHVSQLSPRSRLDVEDPFGGRSSRRPAPSTNPHPIPVEERPIAGVRGDAAAHYGGGNAIDAVQVAPSSPDDAIPTPEPLTDHIRGEAQALIDDFGEEFVRRVYSRHWQLRKSALEQLSQELETHRQPVDVDKVRSLLAHLKKALTDRVAAVFLAAVHLLELVVDVNASVLARDEWVRQVAPLATMLVNHIAVTNHRIRQCASDALLFLAFHEHLAPGIVAVALLKALPRKEQGKPLAIKGRATLINELVAKLGISEHSQLTVGGIMAFCVPELEHRDASVRSLLVKVVTSVYLAVGRKPLLSHLADLRPGVRAVVEQSCADADGTTQRPLPKVSPRRIEEKHASPEKKRPSPVSRVPVKASPPNVQPEPTDPVLDVDLDLDLEPLDVPDTAEVPVADKEPRAPSDLGDSILTDDGQDGKCQFCGEENPKFMESEREMDFHYWSVCPMLIECKHCKQVIEIQTLNEHLLTECQSVASGSAVFRECGRCHEAIPGDSFGEHERVAKCAPFRPLEQANRCPLCHRDIAPGDDGWTQHYLVEGCEKNDRVKEGMDAS